MPGFSTRQTGFIKPGGGSGTLTEVTSPDGSISVTNGTGPVVEVTADAASVGADPSGASAAAVSAHEAAPDPHPQYTTTAEAAAASPVQSVNGQTGDPVLDASDVGADPSGTAASAVAAHVAEPDPHTQYVLKADQRVVREEFPAFVLGNSPAYNLLRTWVVPLGTSFSAVGHITISRGTGATVTTRTIRIQLNARNQGTAAPSGSPISTGASSGDGPAVQIQWVSGGAANEMDLTIRDSAGNIADVGLTYTLREVSP